MIQEIKGVLSYIHIIGFFKGDYKLFFIILYFYLGFIIFILILFLIMTIRLKKGKYNILWPISILKYCLPIICITFFGQIFLLLISTFSCKNGKSYFDSTMNCKQGGLYYICVPTTLIVILLHNTTIEKEFNQKLEKYFKFK